jgi:hypothetical protein
MSDLTRRDSGHIQRPAGERPKNAIDFLPADVQEQARFFFGFYSETLRGTYGIATRLRFWMKHDSLTAEEAREAMRRLMTPERSAEIDTAPKAIAALSSEVAMILRDRREREKTERLREQMNDPKDATEMAKVRAMLDSIGTGGAR